MTMLKRLCYAIDRLEPSAITFRAVLQACGVAWGSLGIIVADKHPFVFMSLALVSFVCFRLAMIYDQ